MLGSMYNSEDTPLFGGNLQEVVSLGMGHEEPWEKLVAKTTAFSPTAPSSGLCYQDCSVKSTEGFSPLGKDDCDWLTENMDLSMLDDLVESGILGADQTKPVNNECFDFKDQPISPAGSWDSGVASPGSATYLSGASSPTSSYSTGSSELIDISLEQFNQTIVSSPVNTLTTEQNAFPDFGHEGDLLLKELGIEVVEDNVQVSEFVPNFTPTEITNSQRSALCGTSELSYLSSSIPTETITIASQSFNTGSPCRYSSPVCESPIPTQKQKGGRKSKVTTTLERKQRKRNQNKNAATRYREKKRQEFSIKEAEQKALEDKNKALQDNVSQVTREIEYLKELMIEVYRIKGFIK
uniref:BZIP domain-containing protein n=1 Tax=Ciona savignyi TaxID=51511 RepID=H2Z8J8_CIOSA